MKTKEQTKKLQARRKRKGLHVSRKIRTHGSTPRLTVFRSCKNIYGQIIDDEGGRTLVAVSSRDQTIRSMLSGKKKADAATEVGKVLAERAKEAGIERVRFDRGWYKFHGRIKALAEAAREGGLRF